MRLVFAVHGMTCTNCSRTISRGLSKLPKITSHTVCLLTEKLIVEAVEISPSEIIDRIEMLGFSAEQLIDFDVNDGEIAFEMDTT